MRFFCSCLLWAYNSVTKDGLSIDFLSFISFIYKFILPLGGVCVATDCQETATREEMDIRNLVLTLSLIVLVGCFSDLICPGPVSG